MEQIPIEGTQKPEERPEEKEEANREAEKAGEKTISRRDFLKSLGIAAGTFALEGFHGSASAADTLPKPEKKELLFSLEEQWKRLVQAAIKDLETRPGLYWQGQEAKEVREVLPHFDIAQFIRALSENSGLPQEEITAHLETLSIKPQDPDRLFLIGEMVPRKREISVYLVPEFFKDGTLNRELLFSTLRHELAHAISVDYQNPELRQMIPWVGSQEPFSIFITPNFYEGATEFISLRASPEKRYQKGISRPYTGGITLSAYVIARLVGEETFTRSYLKKDPVMLARAMEEKIGKGAALTLTEPINWEASLYERGSLDILHNIFKHEYEFDLRRVKEILREAWEKENMEELVAYKMDGGVKMTMNLFPSFDSITRKRFFSINAAAEGPEVTRFKKIPTQTLSREGITVELPRHHVSVVIRQVSMNRKGREENIRFAAEQLRNALWEEDPYHYDQGNQPLLILGVPDEIRKALPASTFEEQWISTQNILRHYITSTLKEVYEQAGVTEEQYIPYAFSPLVQEY